MCERTIAEGLRASLSCSHTPPPRVVALEEGTLGANVGRLGRRACRGFRARSERVGGRGARGAAAARPEHLERPQRLHRMCVKGDGAVRRVMTWRPPAERPSALSDCSPAAPHTAQGRTWSSPRRAPSRPAGREASCVRWGGRSTSPSRARGEGRVLVGPAAARGAHRVRKEEPALCATVHALTCRRSVLRRAVRTLSLVLDELELMHIPGLRAHP